MVLIIQQPKNYQSLLSEIGIRIDRNLSNVHHLHITDGKHILISHKNIDANKSLLSFNKTTEEIACIIR